MASSQLGTRRELQVRDKFRSEGWVAFRAPASLGVADVVAMRRTTYVDPRNGVVIIPRVMLIEVKASSVKRGPYADFWPEHRKRLSEAAAQAGATAWLAWWPSHGELTMIRESEWPT